MKRAFLLLTMLCLATLARADEQTLQVQQALKDQGFYYSTVDGNPGPETDAAIRRYQIRQGLNVTGKLDAPTLASLNLGGSAQSGGDTAQATPVPDMQPADQQPAPPTPAPPVDEQPSAPVPPPPADNQDSAPAQAAPPQTEAPEVPPQPFEPAEPVAPPQQPGPPPSAQRASIPEYSDFFRKTPYESAPGVVQLSTVRTAQARLGRQGFFRGDVDGRLSKSFSRAIAAYQYDTDLKNSGRLDMETLASLNLLPRHREIPGPPPGDEPVYRGIWVH